MATTGDLNLAVDRRLRVESRAAKLYPLWRYVRSGWLQAVSGCQGWCRSARDDEGDCAPEAVEVA
jgi:hypothetical protein